MFLFIAIMALSIVGFAIHLWLDKERRTSFRVAELLLLYQLVFNIGVLGYFSFIGLTFLPEIVADHVQWPMCPFQYELANANLGFGTLGFMCCYFRHHFWTATVIGSSIWLFADGVGHCIDAVRHHNFSEGNTGVLFYSDLLIPMILVGLLFIYLRLYPKKTSR